MPLNFKPDEERARLDKIWEELEAERNGTMPEPTDTRTQEQRDEENRKAKRALWLARAERALEKIALFKLWNTSISTMNPEDGARQEFDKWKKNLGKFLKKAEEYK